MNKKAFALIELIIVIATISILAAFAFVAVDPGKRIGQAQDDERLTEARSIEEAIGKYSVDNLSLPPSIASLENYIPYMITTFDTPDLLDCPEVLGGIEEVNIGTELASYLPILPIDPQEEDPDNNGTGYYLRKENKIVEVKPCDLYVNEDIPSDGLVFAMRMDEDPMSTIPDYSGNNNDGIPQGGMTSDNSLDSKVGRALEFDGVNAIWLTQTGTGYYLDTESPIIPNEGTFSFSLWFKMKDNSSYMTLISQHKYPEWPCSATLSVDNTSGFGILKWDNQGPAASSFVFTPGIVADKWYHVLIIDDGNTIRLYLDGVLKYSDYTPSQCIREENLLIAGAMSHWPCVYNASTQNCFEYFKGVIDEVGIWQRALTGEEILAIYNLQK